MVKLHGALSSLRARLTFSAPEELAEDTCKRLVEPPAEDAPDLLPKELAQRVDIVRIQKDVKSQCSGLQKH